MALYGISSHTTRDMSSFGFTISYSRAYYESVRDKREGLCYEQGDRDLQLA